MALQCDWKLKLSKTTPRVVEILEKLTEYEFDEDDGCYTLSAKWYTNEKDILLISSVFKDITITLDCIDETHFKYATRKFLNGKEIIKEKKPVSKGKQALKLKIKHPNDSSKQVTLKQYLKMQLTVLWDETESFSGKRPFGDSGWDYEVYAELIKAGITTGKLDEDDCVDELGDAPDILFEAIEAL